MPGVTPAEVLSNFGITLVEDPAENQPRLLVDLPAAELVEHAIRRKEGRMASNGALVIETGERTGRSPNDRFIVDTPDVHDKIAWGAVNRPLSVESYEAIKAGIVDYLNERDVFVTRGMAGADRNHTRRLLVACERASQALFIKQMLAVRSPAKSRAPASPTSACSQRPVTSAILPSRASTPAPPWSSTSRSA